MHDPWEYGDPLRQLGPLAHAMGIADYPKIRAGHLYAIYDTLGGAAYCLQDMETYEETVLGREVVAAGVRVLSEAAYEALRRLQRSEEPDDQAVAEVLRETVLRQTPRPIPEVPLLLAHLEKRAPL